MKAPTVNRMAIPFDVLELGDLAVLPDGRPMSVRTKVTLPTPTSTMSGFVMCGEFEALLAIPATTGADVDYYVPVKDLPAGALTTHAEGVANYWAPHLPSVQGAMAEVLWRVAVSTSTPDPTVIVWRGPEPVIFAKADSFPQDELGILWSRRTTENQFNVVRESGLVTAPVAVPTAVPAPQEAPAAVPAPSREYAAL